MHGLLYVVMVPPWQHYDEPTHFEYAWLIANRLTLPQEEDYDPAMRREVLSSLYAHRFFRDMNFFPSLDPEDEPPWIGITELRHPPLYYMLAAVPLWLARHTDVAVQLYLARLVSLALYLGSVWITYRLVCMLAPPQHPLRLAVPGLAALLPAFTDLMTAVNNDAGAVFILTLFGWSAVRLIVRGLTLPRLAAVVGCALVGIWIKNTAAVALVLAPLAILIACFRKHWSPWLWIGGAACGLALVLLVLGWGDAAQWYRDTDQVGTTAQKNVQAPWGKRALVVESAVDAPMRQIIQYLSPGDLEQAAGQTVTLGGWVWAGGAAQIRSPILYDSHRSVSCAIEVGTQPTFFAVTMTVSARAEYLQIILRPAAAQDGPVYYDGLVLVAGEHAQDPPPTFVDRDMGRVQWGGDQVANWVRNPSAERTSVRVRPWLEALIRRYARRSASQALVSLLDWELAGQAYVATTRSLFQSFWARFGWGQVGLPAGWYGLLGIISLVGAVGSAIFGVQYLRRADVALAHKRALVWLALAAGLVWANALLRVGGAWSGYIPVARYTFPAIAPTALLLAGGWWAWLRKIGLKWFLLGWFGFLSLLSLRSLAAVWLFFYGS